MTAIMARLQEVNGSDMSTSMCILTETYALRQGGGFGSSAGFGASAGPFMPMHLMNGGFPGQRPGMGPGPSFGQPQQPSAARTREVRAHS